MKIYFIVLFALSFHAYGSPGSFEINQACVDEGCFEGDAPGFPITINQSGYYILTSNITVANSEESAIRIFTNNVTIDLMSRTIIGTGFCFENPEPCNSIHGHGIDGTFQTRGNRIINGAVTGFNWGVASDAGWKINNVNSSNNKVGFVARPGTILTNVTSFENNIGIRLSQYSKIDNSTVFENTGDGIRVFDDDVGGGLGGSVIQETTIYDNNSSGIFDIGRTLIQGNKIYNNANSGIYVVNGGSQIFDNQIVSNAIGIVHENGGFFDPAGLPILLGRNIINANQSIFSGSGEYVETEPNICGNSSECLP